MRGPAAPLPVALVPRRALDGRGRRFHRVDRRSYCLQARLDFRCLAMRPRPGGWSMRRWRRAPSAAEVEGATWASRGARRSAGRARQPSLRSSLVLLACLVSLACPTALRRKRRDPAKWGRPKTAAVDSERAKLRAPLRFHGYLLSSSDCGWMMCALVAAGSRRDAVWPWHATHIESGGAQLESDLDRTNVAQHSSRHSQTTPCIAGTEYC